MRRGDSLVQAVEMVPQNVAESPELSRPLVIQAELERLGSCHSIQALQLDIAAQHIQDGAVRLPQELEPRSHKLSVSAILQQMRCLRSARHMGKMLAQQSWSTLKQGAWVVEANLARKLNST